MTNQEKISYAKEKIAAHRGLPADIFDSDKNVFLERLDCFFELIHFDRNAVIFVDKAILDWCVETFAHVPGSEIMKGEHFNRLAAKLREFGREIPDDYKDIQFLHLKKGKDLQKYDEFKFEIYEKDRLAGLYKDYGEEKFPYVFDEEYSEEMLAIAALKGDEIVALVSCDNDHTGAFRMISVDTLAEYRGRGLATHLVAKIALETESRGQVPLYVTWGTNTASVRTALAAGFSPVGLWCFTDDAD